MNWAALLSMQSALRRLPECIHDSPSTPLPRFSHEVRRNPFIPRTPANRESGYIYQARVSACESCAFRCAVRQITASDELLFGDDPPQYQTDIPNFERVAYRDIYPGVDAVFYARGDKIEYDLVLKPGARLDQIELAFAGAQKLELNRVGDLLLKTDTGTLVQRRPASTRT